MCYIRSLMSQHEILTILERTKIIRLNSKNKMLFLFKTSLSLKMPYDNTLNDMKIMTTPHYDLIVVHKF